MIHNSLAKIMAHINAIKISSKGRHIKSDIDWYITENNVGYRLLYH